MTKILSLVSLLLTVSIPAWGVSGTQVLPGGLASSCRIFLLSHQTKEILSICSGTLSGPKEVTTAGHCVLGRTLKYFDYQVDCGYSGFDTGIDKKITLEDGFKLYSKGPIFKETHTVSAVQIGKEFGTTFKGNDVAKLILTNESALSPASVASTTDISTLYFNPLGQMREHVNCMISGFGESNGDIAGKLNQALLTDQSRILSLNNKMQFAISFVQPPPLELADITAILSQPIYWADPRYFSKFIELSGRAALTEMPGDSGSALFCQKEATAAWQIIGVDSSVSMGLSSMDPTKVELRNTFGLPDTDYIPL